MKRLIFVIMLNILLIGNILKADSGLTYPPSIGCIIGGTVSLDGKMITEENSDNLTITIKTSDGKIYTHTNGLKNNYYSIEIMSGFGGEAEITLNYNGKKYYVISPSNGKFKICENLGEVKELNIKISEKPYTSNSSYSPISVPTHESASTQTSETSEKTIKIEELKEKELDIHNYGEEIKLTGNELPEDTVLKNGKIRIESLEGKVDISKPENIEKLPKIENVIIKPEKDRVILKKVILKNVDFEGITKDKIEFGEGVIFDERTINNLIEKFKEVSLKNALPLEEVNTEKIKFQVYKPDFPILIENDKLESPSDIVKNVLNERFNLSGEINVKNGNMEILVNERSFVYGISDILAKSENKFSEEMEITGLSDGKIMVKKGELELILAPMPYDVREIDEYLSNYPEIEGEVNESGDIIARVDNSEDKVILCFNGITDNSSEESVDKLKLLYKENENTGYIEAIYSDGVKERWMPIFVGIDTIGKWLNRLKEGGEIKSWSFNRLNGVLEIDGLKFNPSMIYRGLTEEENKELTETEDKIIVRKGSMENNWIIITPEGVQEFKEIK